MNETIGEPMTVHEAYRCAACEAVLSEEQAANDTCPENPIRNMPGRYGPHECDPEHGDPAVLAPEGRIESLEDSIRWHQRRWMRLQEAISKHRETVAARAWKPGEPFPDEYGKHEAEMHHDED